MKTEGYCHLNFNSFEHLKTKMNVNNIDMSKGVSWNLPKVNKMDFNKWT